MNKKLRYGLIIMLAVLAFAYNSYVVHKHKADINIKNSKKLKVGQTKSEVIGYMGLPDKEQLTTGRGVGKSEKYLYYTPPIGTSNGIIVYLNVKTDTVTEVILVEE